MNVKDFELKYNDEKVLKLLKVRKFIIKHLQNLDNVLVNIKRFKIMIIKTKLKFCISEIKMIKFVYNMNKRHFNKEKMIKIVL